jgi:uncharacterized protein
MIFKGFIMKRTALSFLQQWLLSEQRKPLVIRGARQVGKTWLVHHFAQMTQISLFEINFEKKPSLLSLFESNEPHQILLNLSVHFNQTIDPKTSLLFLDEVQASPEILSKLRWFAEDFPQLPVIAAGSLLEFVIANHSFSMPVGRIQYMHLEPLSFEEFLLAKSSNVILDYILTYNESRQKALPVIPKAIHDQLMSYFKEYLIIGGMPAAVSSWIKQNSLMQLNQIHHDLMATYRDDFAKYNGRLAIERLDEVMLSVPKFLGEKLIYSRVNPSIQIPSIKQSLDLLCKARICHRVLGCAANGVPLLAEVLDRYLKVIFLDVGLCSAAMGITLTQLSSIDEISLINKGAIAEQVVGQLLRTIEPFYAEPALTYWHREEKGSNAEIDYVIQHGNSVIPIEVKAGSTGSLKSLHFFMGSKDLPLAVRFNSDFPSQVDVKTKDHQGNLIEYKLISLPFYLLGQLHRLIP